MRIVLDTNVFVSAALKDRSLPAIAVHLASEKAILPKSEATEAQLLEVLGRPYLASLVANSTRDWFRKILAMAETVPITERITACRDATDDKFLELSAAWRSSRRQSLCKR